MTTPIESVCDALRARGIRVQQKSGYQIAKCPAHDDSAPSLSISAGDDGRALLKCHAGCSAQQITEALGLSARDLFPEREPNTDRVVARYTYTDEAGAPLFRVNRTEGKRFYQEHPTGSRWVSGLNGVRRVLYRLPEVLAAAERGDVVYVAEGEKDADALAEHGVTATTSPMGAGKWRTEYTDALRGAHAVIVADKDAPGRKHAAHVAAEIAGVAASVRIVEAASGKDAHDHLKAGHGVEDFLDAPDNASAAETPLSEHDDQSMQTAQEVGVLLSDVAVEAVEWLWYGRIPLGMITVLDGDPGLGKSTLSLDFAARVTQGRAFPDDKLRIGPAGVVLLSAEDDLSNTVRPRLDAAGADVSRVLALREVLDDDTRRPPVLPGDLPWVRAAIQRVAAKLVIIDPLFAFLGGNIDTNKDDQVRRGLHPFMLLASETGAAIVIVRHLNKNNTGGNPLYRGGGSIGIVGAARSGLLVARDPGDPDKRVIASTKCNLAPEVPSIAYHIEAAAQSSAVVYDGRSEYDAATALSGNALARDEAETFLLNILADGPLAANEVKRLAREGDIAERTLFRAKKKAGVIAKQLGHHQGWEWSLPTSQDATPSPEPTLWLSDSLAT